MHDAGYCRIPLHRRDGSISAYALVDPRDYRRIATHRWSLTTGGYARRCEWSPTEKRAIQYFMHRDVMGLGRRGRRGTEVDHINRDRLDNRRCNLRLTTSGGNKQNQVRPDVGTSRFRGVNWDAGFFRRRWRASAKLNRRKIHIGYFDDEVDAAIAAEAWRQEHMPLAAPDPALEAHRLAS
jgi:hypothetical protein